LEAKNLNRMMHL